MLRSLSSKDMQPEWRQLTTRQGQVSTCQGGPRAVELSPRCRFKQVGLAFELNQGPAGFLYSKKETEELEWTNVNSTLQSFHL